MKFGLTFFFNLMKNRKVHIEATIHNYTYSQQTVPLNTDFNINLTCGHIKINEPSLPADLN